MAQPIRIATWNINSLRLRLGLLRQLVAALDPDVICLQETKVPDELFPTGAPAELGYPHAVWRGMKGYNGVAILSRRPVEVLDARPTGAARATAATWQWRSMRRAGRSSCMISTCPPAATSPIGRRTRNTATSWISSPRRAHGSRPGRGLPRAVLVGDLNIAPLEHDVWSHKQLLDVVSHTPPETEGLQAWQGTGFVDAVRHFVPETGAALHVVVVSQPGLARLRPRPPAGPRLGDART